jgi:hypothetical protein
MEGRQLMAAGATPLPDLVATSFSATPSSDWDQQVVVSGTIANIGTAALPSGTIAAIYASPTNTITSAALSLGTVSIPAGLAPGATQNFTTTVTLPPSPLSGMGMNSQLFLDLDIDPQDGIVESNKTNNQGQGLGLDETIVAITPQPASNLIGTAFDLSTTSATWGQTISVTAQIKDNGQGPAPATRAKIVLTPDGQAPGGAGDITVGNIAVPVLLPFQTVNLVQQVTLPATPPTTLGNSGTYTISMIQDADHQTSPLVQQEAMQGAGLDEATLQIPYPAAAGSTTTTTTTGGTTTTTTSTTAPALADLAPGSISLPVTTFNWGQGYVVQTSVQNLGQAASAPTTIGFYLTGDTSSPSQGYFLGQSAIPALAPGATQDVSQAIVLPSRLPYGSQVSSVSYGRILAIVDPENTVNESNKNNNDTQSAPVTLRLLWGGADSIVPTSPPVRTSQPAATTTTTTTTTPVVPAITPQDAAKQARNARRQDQVQAARIAKAAKQNAAAAAIANELRAEKLAAARARAARAAANHAKKGNSVVRGLINYQNNINNNIVGVLKMFK